MNIETINKWLDEEYGCSYTRLEELHDFYFEKYCDLKQENKQLKEELEEYKNPNKYFKFANKNVTEENQQLKDNWNKLKEIIKKEQDCYMYRKDNRYRGFLYKLSEKMQEIEKESNSNAKD